MNKTPRTDSMIRAGADDDDFERGINLCRRLEAELAEARAEIERKNKLIEQTREALAWVNDVSCSFPGFYFEHGEDSKGNECESISECVRAALEAAERGVNDEHRKNN